LPSSSGKHRSSSSEARPGSQTDSASLPLPRVEDKAFDSAQLVNNSQSATSSQYLNPQSVSVENAVGLIIAGKALESSGALNLEVSILELLKQLSVGNSSVPQGFGFVTASSDGISKVQHGMFGWRNAETASVAVCVVLKQWRDGLEKTIVEFANENPSRQVAVVFPPVTPSPILLHLKQKKRFPLHLLSPYQQQQQQQRLL